MAVTNPSDVTSSIPRVYARRVMRDAQKDTFWDHLTSLPGGGGAVIQQEELLNKPGETIYIQVTAPLSGSGQTGDTSTLEGNEEKLSTTDISVTTTYYRHGVRVNNRAQKKSLLDLRSEGRTRLAEWGADKLDTLRFTNYSNAALVGSGSHQLRRVGAHVTDDAMDAADRLTLAEISKTKYLLRDAKGLPWKVAGKLFYIMVIDQWQEYDIKVTDTSYAQAQREAGVRGDSNPLFSGAEAIWDGVIIKVADRLVVEDNSGSVPIAQALMFGKEAFVEAYGATPTWVERDFDYGHQWGVGYGFDYGCQRGFECRSYQVRSSAVPQT